MGINAVIHNVQSPWNTSSKWVISIKSPFLYSSGNPGEEVGEREAEKMEKTKEIEPSNYSRTDAHITEIVAAWRGTVQIWA